jgi:hypothetical protein
MKKLMAFMLALTLVTMSSMAFAQPEARDVGIFTDAAGTVSTAVYPAAFTPIDLYVIGFDLDGSVKGFEFSMNLPGAFAISGPVFDPVTGAAPYFAGPGPINLGTATAPIIGTGGCVDGMGAFVLAHYIGIFFAAIPADATVCIGGTTPSSFNGAPGYLQCDGTLVPFGIAQNGGGTHPNGCLILNSTDTGPVATETTSFGEVKARF